MEEIKMNINDLKIGEYYMFEFKIFKGEPPVMVKLVDWSDSEHQVLIVRVKHMGEKPFLVTVANLRELTSGELYEVASSTLKTALSKYFGVLYDVTCQIWQGIVNVYTMLWKAYVKYVAKVRCKIFDKHDVYWELDVKYSDSDHEHYLVGYCKDCEKRHTKGLYY